MTRNTDGMTYDGLERAGDTAGTFGLWPGVAGVQLESEADVFCPQCARDILGEEAFDRVKQESFRMEPFGGVSAVLSSEEWDCPGATWGHCGINLDVSVIHYDDVCNPEWCEL